LTSTISYGRTESITFSASLFTGFAEKVKGVLKMARIPEEQIERLKRGELPASVRDFG